MLNYMSSEILRNHESFLVWMCHSRTPNNQITRLHERALHSVYKYSTLTFDELLRKDKLFSVHQRNLQKLVAEMKTIFQVSMNREIKNSFQTTNVHMVFNCAETYGPSSLLKLRNRYLYLNVEPKKWNRQGCVCRICKEYIMNLGFI